MQSPENHLGMLMAYNDKSLSPFLSEDFCFMWYRARNGYLEEIDNYNSQSMRAHSWYPPCADDIGNVLILHCEDTLGYGLNRQLESASIQAENSFRQKVEAAIEKNKAMERVVISSCSHLPPTVKRRKIAPEAQNSTHDVKHVSDCDEDEDDSQSTSCDISVPFFEVGGSIAVNSDGILLREKGTQDCGLHIDSTNYLSLTCHHPASFIIELPLYYATSMSGAQSPGNDLNLVAPISSIRDISEITTLRPSVEWLGEPEGEMYECMEDVVNPEENPLEMTLEELDDGSDEEKKCHDLLYSSIRIQISCRDRATRDMLVLTIRCLAGFLPQTSANNDHGLQLQKRLSILPWRLQQQSATNEQTHKGNHTSAIENGIANEKSNLSSENSSVTTLPDKTALSSNDSSEICLLNSKIEELEKVASLARQEEDIRLQEQYQEHRKEVEALQAHLAEEKSVREAVERSLQELETDMTLASHQVETLKLENETLKNEKLIVVSAYEATSSEQNAKILALSALIDKLEGSQAEAVNALERMKEENAELRERLESKEKNISGEAQKQNGVSSTLAPKDKETYVLEKNSPVLDRNCNGVTHSGSDSLDADADVDTEHDKDFSASVHVYPTSELKSIIDQFDILGNNESNRELERNNMGCYLKFVENIRDYILTLDAQLLESDKKLKACEAEALESQAQHTAFLQTLEDKMQIISNEMKEKDQAHQSKCVFYIETIDGLNESISILNMKLEKLDESKRSLQAEAMSNQERIKHLENICAEAEDKEKAEKNKQLSEFDNIVKDKEKLNEECVQLKSSLLELQKVMKEKEDIVLKQRKDIDILSVRLQEAKQQNDIFRTEASKDSRSYKEKIDKLVYELSQSTNTIRVMEARIADLQSETLTLSDERQSLKRQKSAFDTSRNQIAQLRGQLVESDQSAKATRALLDETTAINERLKKEHKEMSIELANVNNLLSQKISRIDELKDRIQVMDNEITSSDKVKSSFRKENARLKEAAKKLRDDSEALKKVTPLYKQQLSKIADGQSRIVDLESALSDIITVRNQYAVTVSALEMRAGTLERSLRRREIHSEREGMMGEDNLNTCVQIYEKMTMQQETILNLESELLEAKSAEPFELKRLNFMVSKLSGEKNHYENKAKSLSKDLQRKLLAGTPLQRELGKMTARLEEVENERNAYRDAMVLACETYSTKEVYSWFG